MVDLDEFGRRVERLMTEVVAELEQPVDWRMGEQTFENPHARILMYVNDGKPWFQIDREEEALNTSDEELKERMRRHIHHARRTRKPGAGT